MEYFVNPGSIVRKIWSDADMILFIFGASAGEFAVHKSVDWLFYTGKLPSDPIARLFSTLEYAQKIIFEENQKALKTLANINKIHGQVETNRGQNIPNWAYKDVLYMLIFNSIYAYETVERPMNEAQKKELYSVFKKVGEAMNIADLPIDYDACKKDREKTVLSNYEYSAYTPLLLSAYKTKLGNIRNQLLNTVIRIQIEPQLNSLLFHTPNKFQHYLMQLYAKTRHIYPINQLKYKLLPTGYEKRLRQITF